MTQRIPVLQTVGHAYGFAFGRYFTTLGIIWLPFVAIFVCWYFLVLPALAPILSAVGEILAHPQDQAGNAQIAQQILQHVGYIRLFELIEYVILIVIVSGITKEVLGLRTGPKFVYLQFGSAELLVLVAFILAFVSIIVVIIGVALAAGIMGLVGALIMGAAGGAMQGAHPGALTFVFAGILVIATICVTYYLLARLLYLIVPASIGENSVAIVRGWELMRGNVLRSLGVTILTLLPILIVTLVGVAVLVAPFVMQLAAAHQQGGDAAAQRALVGMFRSMIYGVGGLVLVSFLLTPVFYGLLISAPAFAYRALVPSTVKQPS